QFPLLIFLAMTAMSMRAHALAQVVSTVAPKAPAPVAAPAAVSHVKSYREWKRELVQDAQSKVNSLKTQIEARRLGRTSAVGMDPNLNHVKGLEATFVHDATLDKLEKDLRAEQYDLDVANDLTVTDYFVGYLTKVQDKKAAFQEVAGKLSADEVAELMTAYANSVFGAHSADFPASATNESKDPVK
ncbi:MAG TPA: hypothetical protein VN132_14370, partial [Bdellovibrio sp.]|nr:hypothetical protein [Bdellovibrio sp.]